MARILISAYACEPHKGSEPAVGWNWAVETARLGHQVCVLTRSNNRSSIEGCNVAPLPNLEYLYYDLPSWMMHCKRRLGNFGLIMYYVLWQWFAMRFVQRRCSAGAFDVVHHVTFASLRYPSFMGGLGIPFYLGPVGGGEMVPAALRASFGPRQRALEWFRRVSNPLNIANPFVRRALGQATKIFVTPATLQLVPKQFHKKCRTQLAIGSVGSLRNAPPRANHLGKPTRLLYVGRLLDCKGVSVAIRALYLLKRSIPDVSLTIIGDGPSGPRLRSLCHDLQLHGAVQWLGWLPREAVNAHYLAADVLVFPALRDSGGMVVLEALASGLPVVCADLGGPGFIVNETCGHVVRTAGRDEIQLSADFCSALEEILSDEALLASLSRCARERAGEFEFRRLLTIVYGSGADLAAHQQLAEA